MSATSSSTRWKWSQAGSPVSLFATFPSTSQNVSQIDGSRPSSVVAPSIWKLAVAAPQRKPSGKVRSKEVITREVTVPV